jgi:hypothetical protein
MLTSGRFPTEQSKFFDFIELERKELDKVRWLESEMAGHDVGHDRAVWVWITRHRDAWRRGLRESGLY